MKVYADSYCPAPETIVFLLPRDQESVPQVSTL